MTTTVNVTTCPVCDGPGDELGALGWTLHLRCRDCGTTYHVEVDKNYKPEEEPDEEEDDS